MVDRQSGPFRFRVASCQATGRRGVLGLLAALLLAACGDGTGDIDPTPQPADVVRGQAAGSVTPASAAGVTVDALSLKATRRITRNLFEYDFEVSLANAGEALADVAAQVSSAGTGTTVIDGLVNLGQLPVGTTAVSADTITLRHDRTVPFSLAALVWTISGTRAQSSDELIAQALAAGDIDDETALVYRTYAAFDSGRLPSAFRSGVVGQHSGVLTDVIQRWDTLSADAQRKLEPYLQRPNYEGSWLDPAVRGSGAASAAAPEAGRKRALGEYRRCLASYIGWTAAVASNAKVWVWYRFDKAGQEAMASKVASYIESSHAALVGSAGFKAPLDDESVFCNGGDSMLDVYLVEGLGNRGETVPNTSDRYRSSVYVFIRDSLDDTQLMHAVSHEFMHAVHWAYKTQAQQDSYGWFRDGIANWATGHVDRGNASLLDMAACLLKSPHIKLESRATGFCGSGVARDYGAYLPLRFIEKTVGLATVRNILAATETYATAAEAMDKTLPDGLARHWPLFGARMWNQEATDDIHGANTFKVWDLLKDPVAVHKPVLAPDLPNKTAADLNGQPKAETELAGELEHLSNKYYHFTFADEGTRSLMFHNTFQPQRKQGVKVAVRAFYKAEGGNWKEEDWSDYEWIGFCRDAREQRLSDLVIVLSSAEWRPAVPQVAADKPPTLKRNNIGCWGFKGTTRKYYQAAGWNAGGKSEVFFEPDYENPGGTPNQYTDAASGRLRIPLIAPLFNKGKWRIVENFSDGGCTFSVDQSGTSGSNAQGGDAFSSMVMKNFNEALPDALRASVEQLLGPNERAYHVNGGSTVFVKGTVSGQDCGGATYDAALNEWLVTNVEVAKTPVVQPDGSLKGTFDENPSHANYTLIWEWDLVPVRQP